MSLGYVDKPNRPIAKRRDKFAMPDVSPLTTTHPPLSHAVKFKTEYVAKFSFLSIMTLFSAVSVLSIASFASVGSIVSLFSITSVLSIGSTNSVLSAFSNGCVMHILTDCMHTPDAYADFTIDLKRETYDTMAKCTQGMYEEYKRSKDTPYERYKAECGYQDAQCKYGRNGKTSGWLDCEVRRKGSSTWTEMDSKPSFKIKKLQNAAGKAYINFATVEVTDKNVAKNNTRFGGPSWIARKLTLNNAHFPGRFYQTWSEVDAFDTFRKLGKSLTPRAEWVSLTLMIDETHVRESMYSMVEAISDDIFVAQQVPEPYSLYEVDAKQIEFKRDSDDHFDEKYGDIPLLMQEKKRVVSHLSPDLNEFNDMHDTITYYVGEEMTGHWDGACLHDDHNNYYLAMAYKNGNFSLSSDDKFTIIPSGVDNTFQGCLFGVLRKPPTCLFMQNCLENPTCRNMYIAISEEALARTDIRRVPSCGTELLPGVRNMLIGFGVPLVLVMVLHVLRLIVNRRA